MALIFGERLDGTHHWFSLTLSLWAIRVFMPCRTPFRVISAGALTGVAAFFTQTGGAAAVIALLFALLWEHFAYGKSWSVTLKRIVWTRVARTERTLYRQCGVAKILLSADHLPSAVCGGGPWVHLSQHSQHVALTPDASFAQATLRLLATCYLPASALALLAKTPRSRVDE